MLITVIVALFILWILGYAPITGVSVPNITLFSINNHAVTLWELLTLVVIGWAISILPNPLNTIASILLLLWVLSVLGILAISGLPNIIVLAIIIGLVASLFRH